MQTMLVAVGIGVFIQYLLAEHTAKLGIGPKKSFRRMKEEPVPLFGGIGIFATLVITALIFRIEALGIFLLISSPLVIGGLIDDIFEISAKFKLLFQFAAAGLLIMLKYDQLIWQAWAPDTLLVPMLTIFVVICLCNAINFIDGLDGAAVLYVLAIAPAIYLVPNELQLSAPIFLGTLASFYIFNKNPAKLYMGDVGSNLLGFTLAYFFLTHQPVAEWHFTILGFLMMVSLPLMDVCMAIVRRISSGQSPFHADKDHIHHRLVKIGLNEDSVSFIYFFIGALCANVGYLLLKDLGPLIKLSTLLTAASVLTIILLLVIRFESMIGKQVSQFGRTLLETYLELKGSVADHHSPIHKPSVVIDFLSYYHELQRHGLPGLISFVKDVAMLLEKQFPEAEVYLLSSYSIVIVKDDGVKWSRWDKKSVQDQFLKLCERHKVPRLVAQAPEGVFFCDENQTLLLFANSNTDAPISELIRAS